MSKKANKQKDSSTNLRKKFFSKANITKIYLPALALLFIILTPIIFEAFKIRHQRLDNIIDAPAPPSWYDDLFNGAPSQDIDPNNDSEGFMDDFTNGLSDPERELFTVTPADHYFNWRLEVYDTYTMESWEKDLTLSDYSGYSTLPSYSDGELFVSSDIVYSGGSFSRNFPAPYNYVYGEEFSNNYEFEPTSDWIPSATSLESDIYGTVNVNAQFSNQIGNSTFNYPVAYTLQDNDYIKENSNGFFTLNNLISLDSSLSRYLQLPSNYSSEAPLTYQIANSLKNDSDTVFIQVFRNMVWLNRNNTYDIDMLLGNSDDSPAAGEDYVEWFLNRRMGTAAHFAASLAMICRIQEIPTRIVIGFSYGDRSGDEFTIKAKHVHSWIEAFIPIDGTGYWVAFDPSPLIPGLRDRYGENTIGFQTAFYCSNEFFLSPEHMLRQITPPYFIPNPLSDAWYTDPITSNVYGPYVNRTESFTLLAFLGNGDDEDLLQYLITGDLGDLVPIEGELIQFIDITSGITLGSAITNSSGFASVDYSYSSSTVSGLHYIIADWLGIQVPTYDLRYISTSYVETGVIVTGTVNISSSPILKKTFSFTIPLNLDLELYHLDFLKTIDIISFPSKLDRKFFV